MKQVKRNHYYNDRELVKTEVVTIRFTEKDYNQLISYCKDNNIKHCNLIRELVSKIIYKE